MTHDSSLEGVGFELTVALGRTLAFVEFHLEVDGDLPVRRAHAIADSAERAVRALFPAGAEVTAHLEPAGVNVDRLDDRVL